MQSDLPWQITPGKELHWRKCDQDEIIVFDASSGDTHLLNAVAARVLQILQSGPVPLSDIAESLASSLDLEANPEFIDYIERLLKDLHRLGLIQHT